MSSDKEAILDLVENWAQSVRNEDIAGITANHSKDIVMFDVPPPLLRMGIKDYEQSWEVFFTWADKPVAFELEDLKICCSDSVAFCYGIGHCGGTDSKGVKEKLRFRLSIGLEKQHGQWIIIHEHHSLPS